MTSAPAWAKGFDMAFLKEVAALFRQEFKPHTYGAFGVPNERDVADAMAADKLMWTKGQAYGIAGAAIIGVAQRPSSHEDFAGRRATIQAGDVFIKAMAGTREGMGRLLAAIDDRAARPTIWWEAHVESKRVEAMAADWPFERVMTKIAASSGLKGLYLLERGPGCNRRPAPLDPADVPGVKLLRAAFLTPADLDAIRAELHDFGHAWTDHYSSYNKRHSWSAFALSGFDAGDPGFIIKPAEMSRAWKEANAPRLSASCGPTLATQHFPHTWTILGRCGLTSEVERVRFMRLSAGGELTRHADITDPDAGTAPGKLARLHVPIRTSPGCVFRAWRLDGVEERVHMEEGSLVYLDTRKPHAVINPGEAERVHLVIDAGVDDELRRLIAA